MITAKPQPLRPLPRFYRDVDPSCRSLIRERDQASPPDVLGRCTDANVRVCTLGSSVNHQRVWRGDVADAKNRANAMLQLEDKGGHQVIWDQNDEGEFVLKKVPNVRQFDYIKRGLDDAIAAERDSITGRFSTYGHALNDLKQEMLSALDKAVPAYATPARSLVVIPRCWMPCVTERTFGTRTSRRRRSQTDARPVSCRKRDVPSGRGKRSGRCARTDRPAARPHERADQAGAEASGCGAAP